MILPATPSHATAMAAIHAACFTGADAWTTQSFASLLATSGTAGLIDNRGGLILVRRAADQADIVTLAVIPELRRQGLAAGLLAAALSTLHAEAVADVFLEVAHTNTAAAALYRKFGFITAGQRKAYYPDGADAFLMRLALYRQAEASVP